MGGCQSAADGSVNEPQKMGMVRNNKFKKLEKHHFDLPAGHNAKL